MQVLAVSPEYEYANEADVIVRLLQAGLARYHVRKPMWTAADCAALLDAVPREWHARLSLHQHHSLTEHYAVGLHYKDGADVSDSLRARPEAGRVRSRSLHRLADLESALGPVDYAFLSPIFSSISKRDYLPAWSSEELVAALSKTLPASLYALGGICAENVVGVRALGFDGVVLHGALWQAEDPLAAFDRIRKELV